MPFQENSGMISKFDEFLKNVRNTRVDVVGIGISNTPVIKLLAAAGAYVTAYDKNTREGLGSVAGELEALGVTLVLGEHYLDKLSGDIIIKFSLLCLI